MLDHRKVIVIKNFHHLWIDHYHQIHYELFSIFKTTTKKIFIKKNIINIYFRCFGNVERFFELFDVTGVGGLRSGTS
jgi:hypothetical protein